MANNNQISGNTSSCAVQEKDEAKVAVVMVPNPLQGHINQLLHLSRIISSHDIPVHFVSTPTHNRQAKLRAHGWNPLNVSNLIFHDFQIPSFHNASPDPNNPEKFPTHAVPLFFSYFYIREPLHALLHELAKRSKRVVVIIDFSIYSIIPDVFVSSVPNTESYCFHTVSAFVLHYLVRTFAGKPVLIDGEIARDLPSLDRAFGPKETTEYFREHLNSKTCNHGNLYNTCRAIEDQFLNLLAEDKVTNTDNHWAIGPFNPVFIPEKRTSNKCLEWLDQKQPKSVIFVAFGSSTSFSDVQVKEIALGLERSGQDFIWVIRDADRADIFAGESRKIQLPEGFEERIEGRGIIVRDWAPQLEILGHPSTGGFMSHCGWSSTIETISMGVPVAAWPMHSDQPLNAILITRVLKIGLLVREWVPAHMNETVTRSETIEEAVIKLMTSPEGDEMRNRAEQLSTAVKQSVREDGATVAETASFIAHITR